jgi:hypothetical protein
MYGMGIWAAPDDTKRAHSLRVLSRCANSSFSSNGIYHDPELSISHNFFWLVDTLIASPLLRCRESERNQVPIKSVLAVTMAVARRIAFSPTTPGRVLWCLFVVPLPAD